jgi:hypothetical protein
MPVNKKKYSTATQEPRTSSLRRSSRKAPGTRLGIWEDWRQGSSTCGKLSGRHGHVIRDGR